jgi:hypothetical protein
LISKRLRYEILLRDNHRCRYCGATANEAQLVVDHVIPEALGGSSEPSNLVTACQPCNAGKTSTNPSAATVDDVAADQLRWAMAMEKAAAIQASRREEQRAYVASFDELWSVWQFGQGDEAKPGMRPSDWASSVERWHSLNVTIPDLEAWIEIAMRNQRITNGRIWKYFCGVVWNKIQTRIELAKEIADASE